MIIQSSYFEWINLNTVQRFKWNGAEGTAKRPLTPHFELYINGQCEIVDDEDQIRAIRKWISTNSLTKSKPSVNPGLHENILPRR